MSLADFLQELPYFAELERSMIERVCAASTRRELDAGEVLVEQGHADDAMYLVVDGEFEVVRHDDERQTVLGRVNRGELIGEMAMLGDSMHGATATAITSSAVIVIGRGTFDDLIAHPGTATAMINTFVRRLRASEAAIREQAQLAALGTLAAGLMHEVNNPTAAARSAVRQVTELLERRREVQSSLASAGVAPPATGRISGTTVPTGPLERADAIGAIDRWARQRGGEIRGELAATLADAGWDPPALDRMAEDAEGGSSTNAVVELAEWIALDLAVAGALDEAGLSLARISELVDSMRTYARVGAADVARTDVHAGIRDTLVVLRSALAEIEVIENLDPELPEIDAYGAELNQVWTNLLTNAADAMGGRGTITITTRAEGDHITVEVTDDGPGIPPDERDRIFDAFHTTKEPGAGTGLGLHIVSEVVRRHGGRIDVDAEPGRTRFSVRLPVRLRRAAGGDQADGEPSSGSPRRT